MKKTIIFIAVVVVLIGLGVWYTGRLEEKAKEEALRSGQAAAEKQSQIVKKLQIKDITAGTGAAAQNGDKVTVNYTGRLTDGTEFDSSYKRGEPFSFVLGNGDVIKGWDLGLIGMKVGGKRELIIPPELGYGAQGAGNVIPPNATLIFDIELISVSSSTSG